MTAPLTITTCATCKRPRPCGPVYGAMTCAACYAAWRQSQGLSYRPEDMERAHPDTCTCPDCDPDTHNDDAAIAAHEAKAVPVARDDTDANPF